MREDEFDPECLDRYLYKIPDEKLTRGLQTQAHKLTSFLKILEDHKSEHQDFCRFRVFERFRVLAVSSVHSGFPRHAGSLRLFGAAVMARSDRLFRRMEQRHHFESSHD